MDKNAQKARDLRLAQALRTNLRRRKAADGVAPSPGEGEPVREMGAKTGAPASPADDSEA